MTNSTLHGPVGLPRSTKGVTPTKGFVRSVVRERIQLSAALTAVAVGIAVGIAWAFGIVGLALFLLTMPVPLALVWLSADVVRADETRDEAES